MSKHMKTMHVGGCHHATEVKKEEAEFCGKVSGSLWAVSEEARSGIPVDKPGLRGCRT